MSKFQADMLAQVDPTEAGELLSKDVKAKFEEALSKAGVPEPERAGRIVAFAGQWQHVNATDAARDLIDRTILTPAVDAIDQQFKDQPVVDASLRQVLAELYFDMGMFEAAQPLQDRVLETRRRVLGEAHPATLYSINKLGELLDRQGKLSEAERYFREALDKGRRVLGEEHMETLTSINNMGFLLIAQGKLSEAEPYFREALEKRRRVLGDEHPHTLLSTNNMGGLLQAQGKLSEAEPFFREALEKGRRVLGDEHPDTLTWINNTGFLLMAQGKLSEAEPYYREALEKKRRVLGDEHPETLVSISNLGVLLKDQGKLSEAEPYSREALEKRRRVLGEEHSSTLLSINNMGSLLHAQGKHAEAVELLAPAEAAFRATFTGAGAYRTAKLLMNLGKARAGLREFAAAQSNLLEAHGIFVETPGPAPKDRRDCGQALFDNYSAWHIVAPSQGYAAKAAEWQKKLDKLQ